MVCLMVLEIFGVWVMVGVLAMLGSDWVSTPQWMTLISAGPMPCVISRCFALSEMVMT